MQKSCPALRLAPKSFATMKNISGGMNSVPCPTTCVPRHQLTIRERRTGAGKMPAMVPGVARDDGDGGVGDD
eukprot:10137539-Karenia_brevis.AAC.1